ncbi:MAG: RsmD family RNA methyltransferase [Mesotoga sp.]|jgi:16S rRNA (guanine(966)-N(2))-methyltransferase RsmD|uniref:RsmD family RNA methyltransferase n=1 Tax=Mesotoga sp. TaxID=2053577 RepID=UPI0016961150|nr:RsmD family RNA methyltransferase [Mesotoga sp.]MDI9369040.1 RsmD family RNA methyltransferase [Thermotogota bacterium]NLT45199.1 hypothetical protein [Thermotogaceae bacterium]MDD2332952.1 RsmD family RNA methyltransferase [Mesotoga sp.]MDD3680150.1 RsmD family RNA methyltransferase [Mesotoga sp.]MDD4206389.1 RsmD family RNA methyltransferase [Mesotoga sp.]
MLTITGGKWTRRSIKTTARRNTRYTPQSARKALFDIVDVTSKTFIDLFAGSGIMSFEAMSRGAVNAMSVDVSKKACNSILDNKNDLDSSMNLRIICADFRRAIPSLVRKGVGADTVFADPPFDEEYIEPLFAVLNQNPELVNNQGQLIVETSDREKKAVLEFSSLFRLVDQREYAGIVFSILVRK